MVTESAPTATAPVAPPEGARFMFDDDGERLRLIIQPKKRHGTFVVALLLAIALSTTWVLIQSTGTPFPIVLLIRTLAMIAVLTAIVMGIEHWIGYEFVEVSSERVVLEMRVLVPWAHEDVPRSESHNLRVLPPKLATPARESFANSRRAGRIGFDCAAGTLRFGAQLTEEEAEAICAFLLVRCPDIGARP